MTVTERADARHITSSDVREISAALAPRRGTIEFNIEGDPREDLLAMVRNVKPDQCTLVPVKPGAPASTHTCTASSTLGSSPPRELRIVAILLTLTLSRGRCDMPVTPGAL